ncbi:MAG: ABC transporter permease [Actinomycetota bacterium]
MSVTTQERQAERERIKASPAAHGGLKWALRDSRVLMRRSLLRYVRVPALMVFSVIQPIMFVLLFRYVFGGAIATGSPGVDYVDFLMPGIFVQTSIFGAAATGIFLAEDLKTGMIERFKSLPMARSAVLIGRTASDTVRNIFTVLLMIAVGYLVGFNFAAGFLPAVAAVALAVSFAFPFTWISALIGLSVRDAETAQAASFPWMFPLTFLSSAFVPIQFMPELLQIFARNNPVTIAVDALRSLVLGGPTADGVLKTIAWAVGLTVVFAPLAVRKYRQVS